MKLEVILLLASAVSGCASQQGTAFDRQLLVELEEKNTRLEAEVIRLREQNLRKDRQACSDSPAPAPKELDDATPEDLPVVKMSPEAEQSEDSSEQSQGPIASVRPAAEEPEDSTPANTRPVLKVRGRHEAWVYHRPLTAEDRQAKSAPEATPIESAGSTSAPARAPNESSAPDVETP